MPDRDPCSQDVEDADHQEFLTTYAEVVVLICECNGLAEETVATNSDLPLVSKPC